MSKTIKIILSGVIAIAMMIIIFYLWLPIVVWYLNKTPAMGIDLYNSVTYTSYLSKYFAFPVNGWKYIWFAGSALGRDYPFLFFYLMVPFAKYFGLVKGVQIFGVAAAFVSIAFSYLLFATVSRNRILALVLALGVAYSVNTYKALVYAGGIPIFASQAFFPMGLYFIFKYMQSNNRRYLLVAGLMSGIGMMGHPQNFINFVFPSVVLLLVFSFYGKAYFTFLKIKDILVFGLVTFLVGLPVILAQATGDVISSLLLLLTNKSDVASSTAPPSEGAVAIAHWVRNQFYVSFSDTNILLIQLLWISLAFIVIGLVISKTRMKDFFNTIAVILVAGWAIFYIYLLSIGINIYQGGIEAWYKLFWSVPIVFGLLISQFFGVFVNAIPAWLKKGHLKQFTTISLEIGFGAGFLLIASFYFPSFYGGFTQKLYDSGAFSSTFPEALGAISTDNDLTKFKSQTKPDMIDDSQKNYRLYTNDQTVNLWWNGVFDTPIVRGYIDPPISFADRGMLFWIDAAFSPGKNGGTSLEDDFKTPAPIVQNNISFLLDWNAIKYIEGNHGSHAGYGNLAQSLTSDTFIKKNEKMTVQGGIHRDTANPEKGTWDESYHQDLNYYEIKDDLVTPISSATNAPAVLVIGGGDSFDIVTRDMGMLNMSSRNIIIARGPTFIDDVSLNTLNDFDAVVLYKYDYKDNSSAWGKIAKYVENGGKVFVETGAEVKESSTVDLPEKYPKTLSDIFPIKETKRGDLGTAWDSEGTGDMFENNSVSSFSNLIFDNKPWNISYPPNKTDDLTDGSKVLITLRGYPVLAEKEYGKGLLIWSGFNLPYHALYNFNMDESKLFMSLLQTLYGSTQPSDAVSNAQWVSPEKRIITANSVKGVLFKEGINPGWSTSINSDKGSAGLPIYKVGPASPGFMYVRIPSRMQNGNISVTFSYNGSPGTWLPVIISVIAGIIILNYIFFKNNFLIKMLNSLHKKIRTRAGSWWEKEDE